MSDTTASPNADQNNQTDESKQQPQSGELSAEQLDSVSGGGGPAPTSNSGLGGAAGLAAQRGELLPRLP
jgi:hypothetical protein